MGTRVPKTTPWLLVAIRAHGPAHRSSYVHVEAFFRGGLHSINGTTVHQFSGLGRGEDPVEDIASHISRRDAGQRSSSLNSSPTLYSSPALYLALLLSSFPLFSSLPRSPLNSLAQLSPAPHSPLSLTSFTRCTFPINSPPLFTRISQYTPLLSKLNSLASQP